jgi:hypothetical protein
MMLDKNFTPSQQSKNDRHKPTEEATEYPASRFGALLAASLLRLPGEGDEIRLIDEYLLHLRNSHSLCDLETAAVLFYIKCPYTSHVIESMLSTTSKVPMRRKILNHILGSVVTLSTDPAGSHIIDACWSATQDIRHYREKMAREMAEQADLVRNDFFGRRVWRNWSMDAFVGSRFDWGREHGGGESKFAKMPVVKKKEWKRPDGKEMGGSRGIVKKHITAIKREK